MQIEIYINRRSVDVDSSTVIAETRQINDFFEINDRQSSYTNSFKLPKTDRNKLVFGGMGIIGNTSKNPYRIHNVDIFKNGIQVVSSGIGYFKATDGNFNMHVYSENINLFDVIGDRSLADLNLAPLNHELNIVNWLDSFQRSDYIYAIADYGKLDNTAIEIDYQIPSIFVKHLWNLIFSESGHTYTYSGRAGTDDYNPFLTDEWSDLAITIDEGLPTNVEEVDPVQKLLMSKIGTTFLEAETVFIFGVSTIVQPLPSVSKQYISFIEEIDPDSIHDLSRIGIGRKSRIRIKDDGFYRINIFGFFNNLQTENLSAFIEKDGVDLFTIKEDIEDQQSQFQFEQTIYLRQGDELSVKIVSAPSDNRLHYSYDLTFDMHLDNSVNVVSFNSYLSKIKQRDFVKDVCNHFGLMFRRQDKEYQFIAYEELLNPLAIYTGNPALPSGTLPEEWILEDWSDKFNDLLEEDSNLGAYAKTNRFKYQYDNPDDTYADGILSVDDQTLENETTLISRIYKAPDRSQIRIGGNQLRKCSLYETELNEDGSFKFAKAKKGTPYFFRVERIDATIDYKLAGAIGSNSFTGPIPLMSFENLDFNAIIPERYAAFAQMINYGKKMTVNLHLNIIDIHNLDFFKLKYIKQLGKLFYCNKISGFTGDGLVKTELIEIKSTERNGQFSDDFSDDFNN